MIVETNDINILSKIKAYFQQLKDHDQDWWDTLSDCDKQLINKGVEQLNEEKGIYHNDVKGKVNKLLSEDDYNKPASNKEINTIRI